MHPSFINPVAEVRHQEVLAWAERRRAVRRLVMLARRSRREQRAERRMYQATSKAVQLRADLER